MREYVVIKKGSSIQHCIKLPDDFVDIDLEIKISPVVKAGKISQKIESLYEKYRGISPFNEISNPKQWQSDLRNEWT